ncbi:hypothetical protein BV25DRAFT_1051899 [Artomyces pyxidatus]|uniref:Uncharacterized protein n=1 Tax=Artomyces pyxidatus TaxID=48021 RepID=A0ACB8SV33_9AGAM|nr:hypothetical protein BV25DRAFT_1051899 [Artomyces pyxidatus]
MHRRLRPYPSLVFSASMQGSRGAGPSRPRSRIAYRNRHALGGRVAIRGNLGVHGRHCYAQRIGNNSLGRIKRRAVHAVRHAEDFRYVYTHASGSVEAWGFRHAQEGLTASKRGRADMETNLRARSFAQLCSTERM